MVESGEVERYQKILEALEDLENILDILHCEVSALKKTVNNIESAIGEIQGTSTGSTSSNPMFG